MGISIVPSPTWTIIAVRGNWFKSFIWSEISAFHDYWVAESHKKVEETIPIRPHVRLTEFWPNEPLEESDVLRSFCDHVSLNELA